MFSFPEEVIPVVIFLLGTILGSFANVIIVRWPASESIVFPRSACRSCKKAIPWYLNIPILSWLALRGKCRFCQAKISIRYPLVEFLMGTAFLFVYFRYGASWFCLEALIFTFGLLTSSFIDLDHMLLPDEFTLGGVVLGLLGAALNPERTFWPAAYGVLFGGGFLWLIAYVYFVVRRQDGMGGGDIKLLAWIGAILGWGALPYVILFSSLTGSIVGILLSLRSSKGLKYAIPFGPYLALGAFTYMVFHGERMLAWYMELHGFQN